MKSTRLLLLILFCILPFPVKAQLYRSLEYAYDSTGNRTQRDSVGYIPQAIREMSRQLDTALQGIVPFPAFTVSSDTSDSALSAIYEKGRLVFTEAEKAASYAKWITRAR